MDSPSSGTSASSLKTDAKDAAADLKDAASDKAQDLKHQAADALESRTQQGKKAAVGALGDVADALHAGADELREHDRDSFARYADMAADQVEQFVGGVRDKSVGEMMDEAERFARRDPGLFIGGAFLLGVFGARFLKASSPDRFDRTAGGSGFGSRRSAAPYGSPTAGFGADYRARYGSAPRYENAGRGVASYQGYGEAQTAMPDPDAQPAQTEADVRAAFGSGSTNSPTRK